MSARASQMDWLHWCVSQIGRRFVLVLLAALAVTPLAVHAQLPTSRRFVVVVRDSAGRPIDGVEVVRRGITEHPKTDRLGRASVSINATDEALLFRKVGYSPEIFRLTMEREEIDSTVVLMSPIITRLSASTTQAKRLRPADSPQSMDDFWRRRIEGKGRTFTRQEIEQLGSVRAALATVPGVRVQFDELGRMKGVQVPRCTMMESRETIAWFIDGMRVSLEGSELPSFSDNEFEAVEIYRGATQLPSEVLGSSCAAVMLWTRRS